MYNVAALPRTSAARAGKRCTRENRTDGGRLAQEPQHRDQPEREVERRNDRGSSDHQVEPDEAAPTDGAQQVQRPTHLRAAHRVGEGVVGDPDLQSRQHGLRKRLEARRSGRHSRLAGHDGGAVDDQLDGLELAASTRVSGQVHRDAEVGVALQQTIGNVHPPVDHAVVVGRPPLDRVRADGDDDLARDAGRQRGVRALQVDTHVANRSSEPGLVETDGHPW